MTVLTIIVAILIGAPILLTVSALLALIPFFLLGAVGALWFKFEKTRHTTKPKNRGRFSDFSPSVRFRLRQVTHTWNRNPRAT